MRAPDRWTRLAFLDDVADAGGSAWAVGGAVRDLALGLASKDLDVVVGGIPAEQLETILSRTGKVSFVGKAFGVFKWTAPGEPTIDIGLPRRERSTGPGHRDFDVDAGDDVPIEADLSRRDFTINAMALSLADGTIVDPFDGRRDLADGILRAVGRATDRFAEDPLRILRGAGFVARFSLRVDADTRAAMAAGSDGLTTVSPERIATELIKLLERGRRPSDGLRVLVDVGAMRRVVPEFLASVAFDQRHPNHHLALDEHVYAVIDAAARRGASVTVRLAAFLHDIAKPETYTEERRADGTVRGRTIGHDTVGAERTRTILDRLRVAAVDGFPADGVDDVVALVRHHLVDVRPDSTARAWRRWLHRVGGRRRAELLLDLWAADREGHREGLDETMLREMCARLRATVDPPLDARALALDGGTLARELGLRGPEIGRMKDALLVRVVDGDVPNRFDDLLEAARRLHDGGA